MARPIAIIFALGNEAEGFVSHLSNTDIIRDGDCTTTTGIVAGIQVIVVSSGPGAKQAGAATSHLISRHQPSWVISAGFSGGLINTVRPGDIVVADSITDEQRNLLTIDLHLHENNQSTGLHVGRVLTVDHVVVSAEIKQQLGEIHHALTVDLESFAVAQVCTAEKVKFLATRVVFDSVEQTLPDEIKILLAQDTRAARWGAVAGSVIRRPSSVQDLWKLRENAINSSNRLGQFLVDIIPQLGQT